MYVYLVTTSIDTKKIIASSIKNKKCINILNFF